MTRERIRALGRNVSCHCRKPIMMRLIFLLLLCSHYSIGQSQNEYIIKYCIGHYNFGNTGEFERMEIFKFKVNEKNFVLTEFQSISNKYVYNSESLKNDKKVADTVTKFLNKKIEKREIENLINQLNINENNFNVDFFSSNLSKKISQKDILKIAEKREQKYWFVDDENGKVDEFGKEKMKDIRNFRYFGEYIQSVTPKIDEFKIVSDAWNFAELGFSNLNSVYRLDFHSVLGQPIMKNNNSDNWKQIINLNVNLILLKILPKESLLIKEIEFENLIESYINWYIENRKWESNGS